MVIIDRLKHLHERFFKQGPLIVVSCRFGEPYSLTKQLFRKRAMIQKIERNIAKMGGFQAFKQGITDQRDEAERALHDKMKKWYTLQKQVEFLNKFKPWSPK